MGHRLSGELVAYHPTARSETDHLIAAIETSISIYRDHIEGAFYQSGYNREQYMKSVFLSEYRRSEHEGEHLPKVLVKAGHWHALRGFGPSNLMTMGSFLNEFAFEHGMDSYIIAIHSNGPPGAWRRIDYPELQQLGDLCPLDQWTLVDLRPFRQFETSGKLNGLHPALRQGMYAADAMLILGGSHRATEALIQ